MDNNQSQNILDLGFEAFLDSCLEAKGIKPSTEELKKKMIHDLAVRLNEWLLTATFKHLNEQDAKDMEKMMDWGANQEETAKFFKERVPNIEQIYAEEMENFKKVYAGT